ncbi:MAG: TIM barrel protein [Anaerolineales bacterium]
MSSSFRFGTVGSPLKTPPKPAGSVGAILYLRSLGLDALELGWVQAVRVTPATCEAIRQTAQEQDVAISVHAPYFINLNADETEWPKSRQRLMDAAHYGHLAGATDIIFHPGSYFGRSPQEVLSVVLPRLEACVQELRSQGNPVRLRPETMGKSAMLGSLEDALAMSKAIPGVEPCLDFAHLHARAGDGSMNTADEWRAALEAYAKALGEASLKRLHIHLSGIDYGLKGEKEHLVLEESDLNVRAIFQVLHEMGCAGRILCESPILEEDALRLKAWWQEIAG